MLLQVPLSCTHTQSADLHTQRRAFLLEATTYGSTRLRAAPPDPGDLARCDRSTSTTRSTLYSSSTTAQSTARPLNTSTYSYSDQHPHRPK